MPIGFFAKSPMPCIITTLSCEARRQKLCKTCKLDIRRRLCKLRQKRAVPALTSLLAKTEDGREAEHVKFRRQSLRDEVQAMPSTSASAASGVNCLRDCCAYAQLS